MDKENLERIMKSDKLTMSEKMDAIKEEMKTLLRVSSYLELFSKLKVSKASKKSKDLYFNLYEQALEELLAEKKKELSFEEIDEIMDHLQNETTRTMKFISDTRDSLLPDDEIIQKSKELTEEDLNYKRLAVAVASGTATDNQKAVFENEAKKVMIKDAESDLELLSKYEEDISKQYSDKFKKI